MNQNKPIILFGAGQTGKQALDYYGAKNVRFFADNYKAGLYHCGIPILSMEDLQKIHGDYEIIITTMPDLFDEIGEQLDLAGIHEAGLYKPWQINEVFVSNPSLERFKNIHKGKRCFLIGNGPSLRAEDLDKINRHGDLSFASNKIYKIYEKTDWRPNYHFSTDQAILYSNGNTIVSQKEGIMLFGNNRDSRYGLPPGIDESLVNERGNVYCFMSLALQRDAKTLSFLPRYQVNNKDFPQFATNVESFTYEALTVTYIMLQWAAYMGIKEIYLLGVDNSYTRTVNCLTTPLEQRRYKISGNDKNHFCSDYLQDGDIAIIPDVNMMAKAYEKAEQYSREHGFRIYNASRGGNVEAFERVNFDEMMR